MRHEFEAYSNLQATLDKIHDIHWESGNEAGSRFGFKLKDSLENSLESKKTIYTINSKGQITTTSSHSFGERKDRKTGKTLGTQSMKNFIQVRTYSTTGTTVVGGLMKAGWTEKRRNGKVIGRLRVYSVNQTSVDILEKMDSGKIGKALWNKKNGGYSPKSKPQFEGTHTPTNFIIQGKGKVVGKYSSDMDRYMAEAIKIRDDSKREPMEKM
jgi:hypothetical protein